MRAAYLPVAVVAFAFQSVCFAALSATKSLTQYTRTIWTQANGLPQDTVRSIAQTADGYLWLATDEGLARFDGYEFLVFNREQGNLPSNSVASVAAGVGSDLWVGTSGGLVHYRDNRFEIITKAQGLPDNDVTRVVRGHSGVIWAIVGSYLCRLDSGKITKFQPGINLPLDGVTTIYEDPDYNIWIGGYGGVARLVSNEFVAVYRISRTSDGPIECLLRDHEGNLWMGSNRLIELAHDGKPKTYSDINGAPGRPIRSIREDRHHNIWLGTNDGLTRFQNGKFEPLAASSVPVHDRVRSIYEDIEGNLWVGTNSGLYQFRDDPFTIYSKAEGMPSDEPTAVLEDKLGNLWVGFHNAGLIEIGKNKTRVFNSTNGLPDDQIFSIQESSGGDLLISSRGGLSRLHDGHLSTFVPNRRFNGQIVFDAMEDQNGHTWIVNSDGLSELILGRFHNILPGGLTVKDYMNVLCEGVDSAIWAGSRGNGLWRLDRGRIEHFTTANGLSSNQIRALAPDPDGTLWIGTFGGGLNRFRNGQLTQYTTRQGLLSDNISHINDDRHGSLWLSTTRGVCRVSKSQLEDLASGKIASLSTESYGIEDGLRSAYPLVCKSAVSADGKFWFPTGRGLAVLDTNNVDRARVAPPMHLVEVTARRAPINPDSTHTLAAGTADFQVRYAGIHLSSPDAVKYSYKLEGQDPTWVAAGSRRSITYTNLRFGSYRFLVKGELKNGIASETSYAFEILPYFYETIWFKCLIAISILIAAALVYVLHVRQLHDRFSLILEERARIARELHDTLAQSFVGISSQLDALAMCLPKDPRQAYYFLDLARRMTRHSLTEARQTLINLRAPALEQQDLPAALKTETRRWTAGSNLIVHVDVFPESRRFPHEIEQNMLRIAQEAVTNALKHASAATLWVLLRVDAHSLRLRVTDDGRGCVNPDISSPAGGHFGLIGMRERAQSIGGEFRFQSQPDNGTLIEVTVPLN